MQRLLNDCPGALQAGRSAQLIGGHYAHAKQRGRAIGVAKATIYRAIKTGRLPAHKLSSGNYAIYRLNCVAYCQRLRQGLREW